MLSPIALFVYNRPWHTQCTLEALKQNSQAAMSPLHIFCDTPPSSATSEQMQYSRQVKQLIENAEWPGEKRIIIRDENLGLAQSIYTGINEILNDSETVIVLEDDLVVSSTFLEYVNKALRLYRNVEQVYQISGFMIPHKVPFRNQVFLRTAASWGWATWKRAWEGFTLDRTEKLVQQMEDDVYEFNLKDSYPFYEQLQKNLTGDLNTWAVKWYAHMFIHGGLCMYPPKSLVRNIGHDNSGIHCSDKNYDIYNDQEIYAIEDIEFKKVKESQLAVHLFRKFYFNRRTDNSMLDVLKLYLKEWAKQWI